MKRYILYCIFSAREGNAPTAVSGVDNQPIVVVGTSGLAAAVSGIDHEEPLPDLARLIAYKKVVDYFHRRRTVIPMRYGCVVDSKQQVRCLLRAHGSRYETLLEELRGCVEMGIRILNPQREIPEDKNSVPLSATHPSAREFLAARKDFYLQQELSSQTIRGIMLD